MARWVVDGMNVIGARPDGWWRDRAGAARRLRDRLRRLVEEEGEEFTVVFDRPGLARTRAGTRAPTVADTRTGTLAGTLAGVEEGDAEGVTVVYAERPGRDGADHTIVALVAADPSPTTLHVVTADRALARQVSGLGARVVTPSALYARLDRASASSDPGPGDVRPSNLGTSSIGAERPSPGVVTVTVPVGGQEAIGYLHLSPRSGPAMVMVGGVGNDVEGPSGAYVPLAEGLRTEGISALRLSHRYPARLDPCLDDVLAACDLLAGNGAPRLALLGWSFGGAVVLSAGARHPLVVGVATVATQSSGAGDVARLSPKSVLLTHGTDDEVLPAQISESLYARAGEPKRLVLFRGDGHSLERSTEEFVTEVLAWAVPLLTAPDSGVPAGSGDTGVPPSSGRP